MTGGTPPLGDGCTADANYRTCIKPVLLQNEKYYKRFPEDIKIVQDIVHHLAESEGGGVRNLHCFVYMLFYVVNCF